MTPSEIDAITPEQAFRIVEQAIDQMSTGEWLAAEFILRQATFACAELHGRTVRARDEEARAAGKQRCALCKEWRDPKVLEAKPCGYGETNHYFVCNPNFKGGCQSAEKPSGG